MPGVLSTMRDQEDSGSSEAKKQSSATISENVAETTVFESSSYESDYSNSDESDYSDEEVSAEEKEATAFLNELLKNQSKKDGDFKRIESMLLSRQSPPKSSNNDSSVHTCLSSNCCPDMFSLPCAQRTVRNSEVVGAAPSSSSRHILPSKQYPLEAGKQQVHLDSKQDRLAYESHEKFLSSDTILSIVSKRCCNKRCLQSLSPNAANFDYKESMQFVHFIRKDLVQGTSNQQEIELNIRNIIQSNSRGLSDETQRLRFDYHLSSPRFMDNKKIPLCLNSFSSVLDLVKRKREQLIKAIKKETSHNNISLKTFSDRTKVSSETFQKIKESLARSDIEVDWNTLTNFIVPNSVAALRCKSWMKQHFNLIGDKMPNTITEEIHLDSCKKSDIYEEYTINMRNWYGDTSDKYLSSVSFNKLWEKFYPHVKIREHKAVSGKCTTCEMLSTLRRTSKDMRSRSQLTLLHGFHREMYMGEREAYYDRAEEAMFNPNKYMSLMIDGMDKVKTKIPRFSQNLQTEWQMSQHITGILDHGRGSFFYRSYPNMKNDGNEGLHCLLLHLATRLEESHVLEEKRFLPEIVYIQSDGGGQFNNKTTLAVLAYLVARKVGGIKKIVFSRLPVGHTHDDADAKFGEIWRTTLTTITVTPAEYKDMVISCLGKHARVEVIDIFVCPNYYDLFKGCIDPHWKLLKVEGTQLQYTFQSVPRSETYRMGVKTNYRAFSRECVFEIIPVDAAKLSHVYTTDYRVMYSKIPDQPENPNEVINLIEKYPTDIIKPGGFVAGSSHSYAVTLTAIKNYYGEKSKTAHEWQRFVNPFLPIHDNVQHYLRDIDWNSQIPLKKQLFGSNYPVDQSSDIPAVVSIERARENKNKSDNYHFDGLRVVYGKSTASVKHRGNVGQLVPDHREILEDEAMATNPAMAQKLFVKSILSLPVTTTVDKLKKFLADGNIKHKKGSKEILMKALKDHYRPLLEEIEISQSLLQVTDKVGAKRKCDDIVSDQSEKCKTVKVESNSVSSDLFSKGNLEALSLRLGISVEINKSTGRLKGINTMKIDSLRKLLEVFHEDTSGSVSDLRTRLTEFIRLKQNDGVRI